MKQLIAAGAMLLLGCASAEALTSRGFYQFTPDTATALPSVPVGSFEALVVCDQPVMWRDDGTSPTASVGMYLGTNAPLPYTGNIAVIKFIKVSATATCGVTYFQ